MRGRNGSESGKGTQKMVELNNAMKTYMTKIGVKDIVISVEEYTS